MYRLFDLLASIDDAAIIAVAYTLRAVVARS